MISFVTKPFAELTVRELYALLRLRSEVFVVEQHCVFLDMDNLDQQAVHVMAMWNGELAGCTRILAPGVSYADASIGRVVTSPRHRSLQIGRQLMETSVGLCQALYPGGITIGAQLYLKRFYEGFGFIQSGEVYLEDGIEHIKMKLV